MSPSKLFEIVGHIPATTLAGWGLTEGEVRLVLRGEPISTLTSASQRSAWVNLRPPVLAGRVNPAVGGFAL